MTTRISTYPIPSGIVVLSAVASVSNGSPTAVTAWIASRDALLPDSVTFIEDEGIVPEIVSRAGVEEDVAFTTISQVSYEVVASLHKYKLQLDVSNG